jgi:hypothetical protein
MFVALTFFNRYFRPHLHYFDMLIGYARTSTQDLRTNQDCKRNVVEQSAATLEALSFWKY